MPSGDVPPSQQRRLSRATIIVIVAACLFIVFFCLSNWFRQVNLKTAQFDMGNMDQVLWHMLHGQWFRMTDPGSALSILRSTIHADFLLLIYLPFYAVAQDPRTVLILQVLAVASGVVPLYWLARKRLGENVGAFIAVLYLLYPTLEYAVTFDVHAVVLAMPLFLWAWWAATERRWWVYSLAIGLSLLAKEEVGLTVAAMGVYWGWRRGYRTMGIISVLAGLGWTAGMLEFVIPLSRSTPGHFALSYYSAYGSSYVEFITTALTHPLKVLADFFGHDQRLLLGQLLLPVGLVPLLGAPVLLVALPEFAVNFLSSSHAQHTMFFHYMSVITPFVFLAMIDGWDRGRRWRLALRTRWRKPMAVIGIVVVSGVALFSCASIYYWSPLPGLRYSDKALDVFQTSPYRDDVTVIQSMLEPDDRVAATNNIAPQFSRRDMIWAFPNRLDLADAVIVLEGGNFEVQSKEDISAAVIELTESSDFIVAYHRDQLWYFRRK